jgi:demethylmenaquinone methyltransferase/2-methoxy-6-polyprenyl-1,4-benzoquinol methylase
MCLEFSKIDNEMINFLYKQYSKTLPFIGKYIVGNSQPYEYLIKSIDKFYNQDQLIKLMINNGFSNTEYRNLSSGISAIHSGWKI